MPKNALIRRRDVHPSNQTIPQSLTRFSLFGMGIHLYLLTYTLLIYLLCKSTNVQMSVKRSKMYLTCVVNKDFHHSFLLFVVHFFKSNTNLNFFEINSNSCFFQVSIGRVLFFFSTKRASHSILKFANSC